MKSIIQLLFLSLTVILTSCGLGSGNFQKQKFTNLKSLKSSYVQEEKVALSFSTEKFMLAEGLGGKPEKDEVLEIEDPKVTYIKEAILVDQTIVIHHKDKKYRFKAPIYDAFYQSVFGELEEVPGDVSFDSALEFELDENKKLSESNGVSVNDLSLRESIVKSETIDELQQNEEITEVEEYKRPTYAERKTWPEATKEEEEKSQSAKRVKRFFGVSMLAIPIALIGGFLLIIFAFGGGPVGIALALLIGSALLYLIMTILAFVNACNYKKEIDTEKKKMRKGMRLIFGMIFAGGILLGIHLLRFAFLSFL